MLNWLFNRPSYATYQIGEIDYHVVDSGDPHIQKKVAIRLHRMNQIIADIMGHMRKMITRAKKEPSFLQYIDEKFSVNGTSGYSRLVTAWNRLRYHYNFDKVYEVKPGNGNVSFVRDLGEEVHLCLREDPKAVAMTVLAHELAHVISPTGEHDREFWTNFQFMTKIFADMHIISPDEIPPDGGLHCGSVRVKPEEMLLLTQDQCPHREKSMHTIRNPTSHYRSYGSKNSDLDAKVKRLVATNDYKRFKIYQNKRVFNLPTHINRVYSSRPIVNRGIGEMHKSRHVTIFHSNWGH